MNLTLLIKTFENPTALNKILSKIRLGSSLPHEVIIADDGSGQATTKCIENWQTQKLPYPIVHCWQKNTGFHCTRILNEAIREATGDYLVFLDGDCIPHSHFIRDHNTLAEKGYFVQGRRAFIRENAVESYFAGTPIWQLFLTGQMDGICKAFRLPFPLVQKDQRLYGTLGCNLGIWREDLLQVNGYDQAYKGWGLEDSDLVCRLYHLGKKRKYVHNYAVVYHLNHPKCSREDYEENERRFRETVESKKVWCEKGIDGLLQ